MHKYKSLINRAIRIKRTLIAKHCYCDAIKDPIELEVYPYKIDGDFLVCYDLESDQPYAINIKNIVHLTEGNNKSLEIPDYGWM